MSDPASAGAFRYCALPPEAPHPTPMTIDPNRLSAIVMWRNKWVNGTRLRYWFFPGHRDEQAEVVREKFGFWQEHVGLTLAETDHQGDAEIRIAFADDGSWSYVGNYCLQIDQNKPTMNFGWDLTTEWGHATALHEIGHALGLPHEHQNPQAGIEWDEQKVYDHFRKSDGWPPEVVRRNILDKIPVSDIRGTKWDPTSIMEYPFPPQLIKLPTECYEKGIPPNTTPSAKDVAFISELYPRDQAKPKPLAPMQISRVAAQTGAQCDFIIEPEDTRGYTLQTVGKSDAKMVLFEMVGADRVYMSADDDSGVDTNAELKVKLYRGRHYLLSVRVHYVEAANGMGVLMV